MMHKLLVMIFVLSPLYCNALPLDDLKLPPGFEIRVYARVENARQMVLGDNGTVFAGSLKAGKVYALVDSTQDGVADKIYLIADDLNMPSGLAFRNGSLYVAAINRILRYDDIEQQLQQPPKPVLITDDLPDDAHHGWKYLAFGPDGFLYVPVGMPCNVCLSQDPRHGTILRMNPDSGRYSIFASGVRNSVGFDWHPRTGELWFTDNGRDWLGDDRPPDELNRAPKAGLHFGFPYVHGKGVPDPQYGEHAELDDYTGPALELGAHVAPLGLAFYRGEMFPEEFRQRIFIAEHGSWNRSNKVGYQVISVRLDGDRVTALEPFISGWLDEEKQTSWGRPVDVLMLRDGSLLVSDDYAGSIYRVTYHQLE